MSLRDGSVLDDVTKSVPCCATINNNMYYRRVPAVLRFARDGMGSRTMLYVVLVSLLDATTVTLRRDVVEDKVTQQAPYSFRII